MIRFRQSIWVHWQGERRKAGDWKANGSRARTLRQARVTADGTPVPAVVIEKAERMKYPCCFVTSLTQRSDSKIMQHYRRQFTIEETFRDAKDVQLGMGRYAMA